MFINFLSQFLPGGIRRLSELFYLQSFLEKQLEKISLETSITKPQMILRDGSFIMEMWNHREFLQNGTCGFTELQI